MQPKEYISQRLWITGNYIPFNRGLNEMSTTFKKWMYEEQLIHCQQYKLQNLFCDCVWNISRAQKEIHELLLGNHDFQLLKGPNRQLLTTLLQTKSETFWDILPDKTSKLMVHRSEDYICEALANHVFPQRQYSSVRDALLSQQITLFKYLLLAQEMRDLTSVDWLRQQTAECIWIVLAHRVVLDIVKSNTNSSAEVKEKVVDSQVPMTNIENCELEGESSKKIGMMMPGNEGDIDHLLMPEEYAVQEDIEIPAYDNETIAEALDSEENEDEQGMLSEQSSDKYKIVFNNLHDFLSTPTLISSPPQLDHNTNEIVSSAGQKDDDEELKPILKLTLNPLDEVMLEWRMPIPSDAYRNYSIIAYDLFVLQGPTFTQNFSQWSKLRCKKRIQCPMVARLGDFPLGFNYYFAVRMIFIEEGIEIIGPISNVERVNIK